MEIVSQLCISFPLLYYMGCCEDYLTCDNAFNAVMPLSRASTRGSYSEPSASWHGDGGDTAVMGEKLLAGAGGRQHAQRRRRHIDGARVGAYFSFIYKVGQT